MKKCCIVIVTYNAEKWLDVCLKPFVKLPKDMAVVVVDNMSNDKTVKIIKKKYNFVKLFEMGENLGFGRANNIGIRWAYNNGFEHIFLLNQDAEIDIKSLYKLCKIQDEHPEYYCLSPIHYNKNKKIDSLFEKNLSNSGIIDFINNNPDKDIYEVNFCNAALWCLSKKCIEDVGGFSPSFFHYGEDNNYADRIHFYGKKIGVVPSVKAFHYRENPRSKNKFFTDKFKTNYRYMLQELSNPNNDGKFILFGFYRKLFIKLFFALLIGDLKRISRNYKLIMELAKNHKQIYKNKKLSQAHKRICFLEDIKL